MRLNPNRLAWAVVLVMSAQVSLLSAQDESRPASHKSDLRTHDIVRIMRAYDRDEDDPQVLQSWITQLEQLQTDVSDSTAMSAAEKRRRTRFIGLRIDSFQKKLDHAEQPPQADASPQVSRYQSPGEVSQEQGKRHVPVGWRRSRSWQGGGMLPGGSWQGSEYQEAWGFTLQSNGQDQDSSQSPDRYRQQPESENLQQSGPQAPTFDWGIGLDQWPFPTQLELPPLNSGGGVMVGGGASSRSSRSSSSRMMRQSSNR